jgi:4-hydroxybenzoate polyprenyltransferase
MTQSNIKQTLIQKIQNSIYYPYLQMMRLDRPIGTLLLLWPTLWALWVASKGIPEFNLLWVFVCGVIVMRAAGCVINDWADRNYDGQIERTKNRPLATGAIPHHHALVLFLALALFALALVLTLDQKTIKFSFIAIILAIMYPFMKRYTFYPQVVLGAAFSWGMPMAFVAVNGEVSDMGWVLFMANLLWTIAYDTQYAMVDRKDDIKIGLKSTAILFGDADKLIIGILQAVVILALLIVSTREGLGWIFNLSVLIAVGLFVYQQWLIKDRKREACFKAFLNNNWVGLVLFIGIVLSYYFKTEVPIA